MVIIILPNSPIFKGNFCKNVKIFHFSSGIIFGQLISTFGDFLLVTLLMFIDSSHPDSWSLPPFSLSLSLSPFLLWQTCYAIGRVFIVVDSQIFKNNSAMWSHWSEPIMKEVGGREVAEPK